jgi:hypothetical protein
LTLLEGKPALSEFQTVVVVRVGGVEREVRGWAAAMGMEVRGWVAGVERVAEGWEGRVGRVDSL